MKVKHARAEFDWRCNKTRDLGKKRSRCTSPASSLPLPQVRGCSQQIGARHCATQPIQNRPPSTSKRKPWCRLQMRQQYHERGQVLWFFFADLCPCRLSWCLIANITYFQKKKKWMLIFLLVVVVVVVVVVVKPLFSFFVSNTTTNNQALTLRSCRWRVHVCCRCTCEIDSTTQTKPTRSTVLGVCVGDALVVVGVAGKSQQNDHKHARKKARRVIASTQRSSRIRSQLTSDSGGAARRSYRLAVLRAIERHTTWSRRVCVVDFKTQKKGESAHGRLLFASAG